MGVSLPEFVCFSVLWPKSSASSPIAFSQICGQSRAAASDFAHSLLWIQMNAMTAMIIKRKPEIKPNTYKFFRIQKKHWHYILYIFVSQSLFLCHKLLCVCTNMFHSYLSLISLVSCTFRVIRSFRNNHYSKEMRQLWY